MQQNKDRKYITEMNQSEAKAFFLDPSTYVPLTLPRYFRFDKILKFAENELGDKEIKNISINKKALSNTENVNYTLLLNKDARYDWRPLQIVHPIVYVDLVNYICSNWDSIIKRFKDFETNPKLKCISLPLKSTSKHNDKEEIILNWWESLEQASIKYSLNFKYCIKTDITNCYGSIYTHTISWAINGKEWAKNNRNRNNLGNEIDKRIEFMQNGQTNGIPQGGSLFDTIAELVLGYADLEMNDWFKENLSELNKKNPDFDYQIIRYRDDYRIFTNSKEFAERIIRKLSDVLSELNLHFNSKKTLITTDIIGSAIKPDKLYWTKQQPLISLKLINPQGKKEIVYQMSPQKHLWQIYELSQKFPNSGQVSTALSEFLQRIQTKSKDNFINDYQQIISITSNIIVKSPNSIPIGISILSTLFAQMNDSKEIIKTVSLVMKKIQDMPNIGFIEIWLQRLTLLTEKETPYNNPLCQKIYNNKNIWDSSWMKDPLDESSIIDTKAIDNLNIIVPQQEVTIFNDYSF